MSKIQFTSIAALRESLAQQSRVTTVENNLKKLNASWQASWLFPIVAVGLSNTLEDVDWVQSEDSVHADKYADYSIGGAVIPGAMLDTLSSNRPRTKAEVTERLQAVDARFS